MCTQSRTLFLEFFEKKARKHDPNESAVTYKPNIELYSKLQMIHDSSLISTNFW